jgi:hypothetical protein
MVTGLGYHKPNPRPSISNQRSRSIGLEGGDTGDGE